MDFREWLLIEEIQIIQKLVPTHQVVYLGRYGYWDIYTAEARTLPMGEPTEKAKDLKVRSQPINIKNGVPLYRGFQPPRGPMRVLPLSTYMDGRMIGSDQIIRDPVADLWHPNGPKLMADAAAALANLGFPRYSSALVYVDLKGQRNAITGGGIGGYADKRNHGFTIDKVNPFHPGKVITICHEHGHMFYDSYLPKSAKILFEQFWATNVREKVHRYIHDPNNFKLPTLAHARGATTTREFDIKKFDQLVDDNFKILKSYIEHAQHVDLGEYFKLRKLIESGKTATDPEVMRVAMFMHSFMSSQAKAKVPMEYTASRYIQDYEKAKEIINKGQEPYERWQIKVQPGDVVRVSGWRDENGEDFIANSLEQEDNVSGGFHIPGDKLHDFVELSPRHLHSDPQNTEFGGSPTNVTPETFKKRIQLAKKPPFSLLCPKELEETITTAFAEITKKIQDELGYKSNEVFMPWKINRVYGTFSAMVRLRYRKGRISDMEGLNTIYKDIMYQMFHQPEPQTLVRPGFHIDTPREIGMPVGEDLRAIAAQLGIAPTAYASANPDELFAETVAYAATHRTVSKELKKMLVHILSGTTEQMAPRAGVRTITPTRKPRRLERRKKPKP